MKKGFLKVFLILSIILMSFPIKANALTFKVEKSADTVKPNQEVTVYVKATDIGDDSIQYYTINLNYDSTKLDYKSSSSDIATITVANPIVIKNDKGTISADTTIATFVFSVKSNSKAGDANLTINSSDCTTISGNKISATNTSSMVRVVSLSNDATLSSLKIPNTTLSPKFDKNVTEYTTSITDVTELTVNATPTDSNSKIMISENYKNLVKGDNEIRVVVTAEDGVTTKTYLIKVTLNLTPTEEELVKADATLSKLEIEKVKIDFSSDVKKYDITVPYEVKKLSIVAEATNPNAIIEMEGKTTLKVGRNTIKINVTSEDSSKKETYTLNVVRKEEEKEVVQTCPDETTTREWIMFSICMFLTFTLGIVLGYFLCKKEILKKIFKRKNKEEILSTTKEITPIPTNKVKNDEKEDQ